MLEVEGSHDSLGTSLLKSSGKGIIRERRRHCVHGKALVNIRLLVTLFTEVKLITLLARAGDNWRRKRLGNHVDVRGVSLRFG